jgi:hypothetical protein
LYKQCTEKFSFSDAPEHFAIRFASAVAVAATKSVAGFGDSRVEPIVGRSQLLRFFVSLFGFAWAVGFCFWAFGDCALIVGVFDPGGQDFAQLF